MKFKYVKALMIVILLALAVAALGQSTTLPAFPDSHTQYRYDINMPEGTVSMVVLWYYGIEANTHMLYNSGFVKMRCCVIETDMYFPRPGAYIQTIWFDRGRGIEVWRRKYTVRKSWYL
jgi:hypothetical protein